MEPIMSRIRVFSGTYYAYIPLEDAEKYGLADKQPIALKFEKITTEPLELPNDD